MANSLHKVLHAQSIKLKTHSSCWLFCFQSLMSAEQRQMIWFGFSCSFQIQQRQSPWGKRKNRPEVFKCTMTPKLVSLWSHNTSPSVCVFLAPFSRRQTDKSSCVWKFWSVTSWNIHLWCHCFWSLRKTATVQTKTAAHVKVCYVLGNHL